VHKNWAVILLNKHAVTGAFSITLMGCMLVFLHTFQYSEAISLRKPLQEFPEHIGLWRGKELGLGTTVVQLLGGERLRHAPVSPACSSTGVVVCGVLP
jgi:hypothetical protein